MNKKWKFSRLRDHLGVLGLVVVCLLIHLGFCWSLNDEGLALLKFRDKVVSDPFGALSNWRDEDGEVDPRSWFGVECSHRKVVALNLGHTEHSVHRRMLQTVLAPEPANVPSLSPQGPNKTPSRETSVSPASVSLPIPFTPAPSPSPAAAPAPSAPTSNSTPTSTPTIPAVVPSSGNSKHESFRAKHKVTILAGGIGGAASLVVLMIFMYLYKTDKVATVKPWATGLSGQLQKAFVTGVPSLRRSELEAACEYFSNVIGTSAIGTVYKGTLSSGVEIAVASLVEISANHWGANLELQFRKKIETLSKVSHKNFISLIGYCEEEEPFTRMMVFEYVPNGTLFEHLHIKEAEHLDWKMRLRIAMGVAYCLEYMHQLKSPISHNNLNSSAVKLTEDYAAKVSEFSFWNEIAEAGKESSSRELFRAPSTDRESNVYSFGVILFEMVTGRLPYSVDNVSLEDWGSDYLKGQQALKEMVDPMLESFHEEQLEQIGEVIRSCVLPDPKHRPPMKEVTARLREITGISPEGATPKLNPLWWAELELLSPDCN